MRVVIIEEDTHVDINKKVVYTHKFVILQSENKRLIYIKLRKKSN